MSDGGDVIRLVPMTERERQEDKALADAAHDEAVVMLEKTLRDLKEHRVSGIAIAIAYKDKSFGYSIPKVDDDRGRLMGAIAQMQLVMGLQNMAYEEDQAGED